MLRIALICLTCILVQPIHVSAESRKEHPSYAITVYGGVMTDDNWRRSVTGQANLVDTYIVTGAVGWTFYRPRDNWFSLELETSISQHFGTSHNLEFCFPIVTLRWEYFPWDRYIDTSVATGYGLSFATDIPQAEVELDGKSKQCCCIFTMKRNLHCPIPPGLWRCDCTTGLPPMACSDITGGATFSRQACVIHFENMDEHQHRMTLAQETEALRAQLRQWASDPEWGLLVRYELLPQQPSPDLSRRISQRVGRLLRVLGLSRSRYLEQPWHAGLKHAPRSPQATPLLVWSEGHDRTFVREACAGLKRLLGDHSEFLPVLVTDAADFAFYSRLGWLVEYLPELAGAGPSYRERKRRYLAWRYREALAVPVSAGLASESEWENVLRMVRV